MNCTFGTLFFYTIPQSVWEVLLASTRNQSKSFGHASTKNVSGIINCKNLVLCSLWIDNSHVMFLKIIHLVPPPSHLLSNLEPLGDIPMLLLHS